MHQSLFLIKLQAEACNFVKKETPAQVFSFEFAKFLRIPFSGKCFRKDQGENGKRHGC